MMLLMCYVAQMRFAFPVHDVVEVVGRPTFDPIPAAPLWVAGAFVHRGVVTPVIDFAALAGIGESRSLWSSRVIVLECSNSLDNALGSANRVRRVGLLFDRSHAEQVADPHLNKAMETAVQIWPWGKTLIDEHGTYCQLDLDTLFSPQRLASLFPSMD